MIKSLPDKRKAARIPCRTSRSSANPVTLINCDAVDNTLLFGVIDAECYVSESLREKRKPDLDPMPAGAASRKVGARGK